MTEYLTGIGQQGLYMAQQSSHGSTKQHWSNSDGKKCQEINNYESGVWGVFSPFFLFKESLNQQTAT